MDHQRLAEEAAQNLERELAGIMRNVEIRARPERSVGVPTGYVIVEVRSPNVRGEIVNIGRRVAVDLMLGDLEYVEAVIAPSLARRLGLALFLQEAQL